MWVSLVEILVAGNRIVDAVVPLVQGGELHDELRLVRRYLDGVLVGRLGAGIVMGRNLDQRQATIWHRPLRSRPGGASEGFGCLGKVLGRETQLAEEIQSQRIVR